MRRALLALTLLVAACSSSPHESKLDAGDRTEILPGASWVKPTTTTSTAPPTTTTTAAPTTTTHRPTCAETACGAGVANYRTPGELRSTAYCLTGNMSSGQPTYVGAVASNAYALGTKVTAWPNPWDDPGMVFTVEDRHETADADGYPTEFDFAMPGECDRALAWGNTIFVTVEVVG